MASAAVAEVSLPPTALRNYISQRHLNNVLVPPYNGTSLSSSLALAHFFLTAVLEIYKCRLRVSASHMDN